MIMDENYWIPEAMIRTGDNFVKVLGQLYREADTENQKKLRIAFHEYWVDYKFKAFANWKEWQAGD